MLKFISICLLLGCISDLGYEMFGKLSKDECVPQISYSQSDEVTSPLLNSEFSEGENEGSRSTLHHYTLYITANEILFAGNQWKSVSKAHVLSQLTLTGVSDLVIRKHQLII